MSFRSSQIYVQSQTRHRLTLLARVMQAKPGTILPTGMHPNQVTADELADQLLNEAIFAKYPVLGELEKQIKALEDAAIEAIRGKTA